jgi:hypothetical protein
VLICAYCLKEIKPGESVRFIGVDPETTRIFTDEDALVIHDKCEPKQ